MTSPYLDPLVAATYRRITAPAQFAQPARELIQLLGIPARARVLDVGTGTGIVRDALSRAASHPALIVGIDPSIAMLRAGFPGARLAAGSLPALPFRDAVFDAVTASFVLSHVAQPAPALADMVRVCARGGRIGITAWTPSPNPAGALWREIAVTMAPADELDAGFRSVIPSEDRFASAEGIEEALAGAGLSPIVVTMRRCTISMPPADFVASKAASVEGTILQRTIDNTRWKAFTHDVTEAFRRRFGEIVEYQRDFLVATGEKG